MNPHTPDGSASADSAFARFCKSRDPQDLAEVFDITAPRLILLAMHLTGDAAAAEDLHRLWTDPEARASQLHGLRAVRDRLEHPGSYAHAAREVIAYLA